MSEGIHRLVRANDLEGLRALLQGQSDAKAAVNQVDEGGCIPLFYAVSSDRPNPDMVELLLKAGSDTGFTKVTRFLIKKFREPLLKAALKQGDLAVVKLLVEYGADFSYTDENGYTAMIDAVYGSRERLPLIQYLIGLGLSATGVTSYGETAARVASRLGHFRVVAELLRAGADAGELGWTPLIRAVAIGTLEEVQTELASDNPLFLFRDIWDRTAIDVALLKGDVTLVELLEPHYAGLAQAAMVGSPRLSYAMQGGNSALVERLVRQGYPVDAKDDLGYTGLAMAAERGDFEMVRTLLKLGADPNAEMSYRTVLESAVDRPTLLALLEHGADPAALDHGLKRMLLGIGGSDTDALYEVTKEQYLEERYPREGRTNPEDITGPFKLAMIRCGANAYLARRHFDDPASFACGLKGQRPAAVWCADRFGQSLTMLPDGRTVLIAGEHEDSYDPDFCIYNDVFVFHLDETIRIYGYPYSVFPPTDFHTATLVGTDIYIIGSLGYVEGGRAGLPVYRLSTEDLHIEPVLTNGLVPERIYRHRATLSEDQSSIRIEGGKAITFKRRKEQHNPNRKVLQLDLRTMTWSEVP